MQKSVNFTGVTYCGDLLRLKKQLEVAIVQVVSMPAVEELSYSVYLMFGEAICSV